jgi:hypothetical protein
MWTDVNGCDRMWTDVNRSEQLQKEVNTCEQKWTDVNGCETYLSGCEQKWMDVNRSELMWTQVNGCEPKLGGGAMDETEQSSTNLQNLKNMYPDQLRRQATLSLHTRCFQNDIAGCPVVAVAAIQMNYTNTD